MAAGQGGWLRPALGLRLLLATAFQAVSVGRPRGCLRASRRARMGNINPAITQGTALGTGFLSAASIRDETWQAEFQPEL